MPTRRRTRGSKSTIWKRRNINTRGGSNIVEFKSNNLKSVRIFNNKEIGKKDYGVVVNLDGTDRYIRDYPTKQQALKHIKQIMRNN